MIPLGWSRHLLGAVVFVLVAFAASARGQVPVSGSLLSEVSIETVHEGLRSGRLTCRKVVEHYLARIDAYDQRGPALNTIITLNPTARSDADRLDAQQRSSGFSGPLHCIPVLVKDQFDTAGLTTTYGSAAFKTFVPDRDATAVKKLREAGAIILGKNTLGEFASGYAGSVSGAVKNPYDLRRHPSGSSSGTGAAIAADFATVGLAEDTGGSIRGPAAVGSLVGHRPTLPLVSRHGMLPARPSHDTAGPIARTVKDVAEVLQVIAGFDPNDPVTGLAVGQVSRPFSAFLTTEALQGARIGILRQPMHPQTNPQAEDHRAIRAVLERSLGELTRQGAELVDGIELLDIAERIRRSSDLNVFETEAAIDRHLKQLAGSPVRTLRGVLLTDGALLPWRAQALMSSVGRTTEELDYLRVLRNTEALRLDVLNLMAARRLDALVYTTADHHPAFIAADIAINPNGVGDTRLGSNRTLASVLGCPAVTVPAGFTSDGLPVGLEFLGRPFRDGETLGYAYAYEQATRHRRPPATTPPLGGATK